MGEDAGPICNLAGEGGEPEIAEDRGRGRAQLRAKLSAKLLTTFFKRLEGTCHANQCVTYPISLGGLVSVPITASCRARRTRNICSHKSFLQGHFIFAYDTKLVLDRELASSQDDTVVL